VIVMGLDLATASGAAFDSEIAGVPRAVSFRAMTPGGDLDHGREYGRTFDSFEIWLRDLLATVKPGLVGFEAPLPRIHQTSHGPSMGVATVRVLFGLAAIAEKVIYQANVPSLEVTVSQAKAHLAGTGRADKSMMMARCRQLRWRVRNDNEADACAVWSFVKSLKEPRWAPCATPLFAYGIPP
jgi:hypothetical protein